VSGTQIRSGPNLDIVNNDEQTGSHENQRWVVSIGGESTVELRAPFFLVEARGEHVSLRTVAALRQLVSLAQVRGGTVFLARGTPRAFGGRRTILSLAW
jgi:hypothetical protein